MHAGEVVWSQRDVARAGGVHVVDSMRLGLRGYANGGTPDYVRPVAAGTSSAARAQMAANSNRESKGGKSGPGIVQVVVQGASGDPHVRELVRQGVSEGIGEYNQRMVQGGFGDMQNRWTAQKG